MSEAGAPVTRPEALANPVRIPPTAYISRDYAEAERDRLWRKVWQQACREADIPEVGSYVTYDIMDDAIIVVRETPDTIRAFYNVCSHRGRRLVDLPPGRRSAAGDALRFKCGFHAWTYDLAGRCTHIPDKESWGGALTEERTRLGAVKVETWGGWVWVNFDSEAGPLRDYLEPAASLLDPFELQNMRPRWRRWLVFDCNWKTAMEAFSEIYHVDHTHPELTAFGEYHGWAHAQGLHSNIGYDAPKDMDENKAKLRVGSGADPRKSTAEMQTYIWEQVNTNTTWTLVRAAQRLEAELPEGAPAPEVLQHWLASARRDDAARGVVWPTVTPAQVGESGTAWQIFPNFQIGHAVNNMLCYCARPYGTDPNKCYFEVAVYELFPKGEEPVTDWEFHEKDDPKWGSVLPQDFSNMAAVQSGMRNGGFRGAQTNPYRERSIANLHRNLARYVGEGAPQEIG